MALELENQHEADDRLHHGDGGADAVLHLAQAHAIDPRVDDVGHVVHRGIVEEQICSKSLFRMLPSAMMSEKVMTGFMAGKVTALMRCSGPAPSIFAASNNSVLMLVSAAKQNRIPADFLPYLRADEQRDKRAGIGHEFLRLAAQCADDAVDQAVAGEEGEHDAVDDDPGEEVGT